MSILDQILAETRQLVARRRAAVSISDLEAEPFFSGPTLPLAPVLRQGAPAIIAEIKKASPSRGVIRNDFEVATIARQYKLNGASAISVLTEPFFFQGSLQHLALVRQTVDLPLLRKDFILDAYQLYEARAYGADAVLLIAATLDATQLRDLYDTATSLGLSCLVEVHAIEELDHIDFDRIQILGVNNRNLRTFEVDVEHALRVFAHVPKRIVRVSESGLRKAGQLVHLYRHGVQAVLMGETFMRASEPGQCLSALRHDVDALLYPPTTLRLAS
jgi:indole-3-glycerol phosphate synthase